MRFLPGSFAESIEGPEVLAIAGQYADALASRRRGTLILSEAETGLLVTIPAAPSTTAAADLAAQSRTTRILARPVFRPGAIRVQGNWKRARRLRGVFKSESARDSARPYEFR